MAKPSNPLRSIWAWLQAGPESAPPEVSAPPVSDEPFLDSWNNQVSSRREKRASERQQVWIEANARYAFEVLTSPVEVRNLSTHGIYFTSDVGFAVGAIIDVALSLPAQLGGPRQISYQARVVRLDKNSHQGRVGNAAQITRCQAVTEMG